MPTRTRMTTELPASPNVTNGYLQYDVRQLRVAASLGGQGYSLDLTFTPVGLRVATDVAHTTRWCVCRADGSAIGWRLVAKGALSEER